MGYVSEHGIKAICFDIDGTLYPKIQMNLKLLRASIFHLPFALKYNNCRKTVRELDGFGAFPIMSYDEISKRNAKLCFGDDSEQSQQRFREKEKRVFHDFYLRSYKNLKPADGVINALEIAKDKGLRMAALSDFPIGVKLKAMGIERFFDFALSSEDMGHFKPSMTPFIALSDRLGIEPKAILYVGDSYRKDVRGARNAGMHTCLIFTSPRKEYTEADLCVPSWKDFIEMVL